MPRVSIQNQSKTFPGFAVTGVSTGLGRVGVDEYEGLTRAGLATVGTDEWGRVSKPPSLTSLTSPSSIYFRASLFVPDIHLSLDMPARAMKQRTETWAPSGHTGDRTHQRQKECIGATERGKAGTQNAIPPPPPVQGQQQSGTEEASMAVLWPHVLR